MTVSVSLIYMHVYMCARACRAIKWLQSRSHRVSLTFLPLPDSQHASGFPPVDRKHLISQEHVSVYRQRL